MKFNPYFDQTTDFIGIFISKIKLKKKKLDPIEVENEQHGIRQKRDEYDCVPPSDEERKICIAPCAALEKVPLANTTLSFCVGKILCVCDV